MKSGSVKLTTEALAIIIAGGRTCLGSVTPAPPAGLHEARNKHGTHMHTRDTRAVRGGWRIVHSFCAAWAGRQAGMGRQADRQSPHSRSGPGRFTHFHATSSDSQVTK